MCTRLVCLLQRQMATADNHIGTSHLLHTGGVFSDDGLEFESQDDIERTGVIGNTPVSATIHSRISRSPPPMPGLPEMALALVPYDPVPDGDAAAGPPPPPPLFTSSDSDAAMDDAGAVGDDANETGDDDSSGITNIDREYWSEKNRRTHFGQTGVGAHSCSHCKIVGQCIMCGYLFRAYPGGWQTLHFARDNDERPSRRARIEWLNITQLSCRFVPCNIGMTDRSLNHHTWWYFDSLTWGNAEKTLRVTTACFATTANHCHMKLHWPSQHHYILSSASSLTQSSVYSATTFSTGYCIYHWISYFAPPVPRSDLPIYTYANKAV